MPEIFSSCLPCLGRNGGSNKKGEITLLALGLDGAGKSTILRCLQGESIEGVSPTVGFNNLTLPLSGRKIVTYDVGGGPRIRGIWKNYYHDVHGMIYVVDASDQSRLEENLEVLGEVIGHDKSKGKPILVLANKQDIPNAVDKDRLVKQLQLHSLLTSNQNPYRVEGCIAHKGIGSKTDKTIRLGFKWLIDTISKNDALMKRVAQDIANQKEIDDRERKERQARARARREKQEREEGRNGDEVDVTPEGDPFKRVVVTGNDMFIGKDKIEGKKGKKNKKKISPTSQTYDGSGSDDDEDDDLIVTGNSTKDNRSHDIKNQPRKGSPTKRKVDDSDSDSDDNDGATFGKSVRQPVMVKNKNNVRQSFGGSESSDDEDVQTSNKSYFDDRRSKQRFNEDTVDKPRSRLNRPNKLTRSYEIDEGDEDDDILTATTKSKSSKHRQMSEDDALRDRSNSKSDKKRNKNKKKGKGNKIAPVTSTLFQDETHNMLSDNKTSWSNSLDVGGNDSRPRRLKPLKPLDLSGNTTRKSRAYRGQAFNASPGDELDMTSNLRSKPNAEEDDDIVM